MRNWTIKPVLPGGIELPQTEPAELSPSDRSSIDDDAAKFQKLLHAQDPLPAADPLADVEPPNLPEDGARLFRHTATDKNVNDDAQQINSQADKRETTRPAGSTVEFNFNDAYLVAGLSAHGADPLNLQAPVRTQDAAPADMAARVEVAKLVNRLVDRIVVEGRVSSQPVVEIHLSQEVLADTVARVTRSADGLEVALTTVNAEAHNVLNHAAAVLGERLVALEGGLPVLITVSMQGVVTSEFSFGELPDDPQHQSASGRRADGQRKSNHGRS